MELIPLLIIVLGIVSSIAGSKKNKEQEGKRNIDTSKLDRRQNSAPRTRQPDRETTTNEQKGFFQTLQEAFDEEFNKPEEPAQPVSKPVSRPAASESREMTSGSRPERQASERPLRETIHKSRERQNTSQNISDIEKRITDRSKHAKRASEAKESVFTKGYDKRAGKTEGLGHDIANQARYSYGDDVTQMHKRGQDGESDTHMTSDDLTFDSKSFVNGIIMSEILGKPKSKQKSDKKPG
ncbi:hypothetical protein GCM10007275_04970 [Jeotgalicoccus coquinae]|uniref:Uncharacterized protein n=1 Tax=Jeotgalicoccus coquinae TaxID=709509 RepID=A0A6V7RA08_9STAP|nr:hypothetical protein [Jeotgalicoccus coquinae]MBB6422837.1 hypothetical protein [Jeotgalicoccus coquinae]GGE12797.1 hypothetical protein GCM10007275_04970 [Jeotgalicoccus coquinae]CAD2073993.1 hypothetical protein JEOCOQ751_00843 [Jeotgalicoccus coquinae]